MTWFVLLAIHFWPGPDVDVEEPDPKVQQEAIDDLAAHAEHCRNSLFSSCGFLSEDT